MTESFSPRLKPSAASPRAKSRTWSWYSRQVYDCQMPRSFSRIAGRAARARAFFSRRRGNVVRSGVICSGVREAGVNRGWPETGARRSSGAAFAAGTVGLRLAEVRFDHARVRAHVLGRALGDLLAHVEDRDAVGNVHDDAHVVLDEDDRRAPLLVDVEDEARHVLLLLVVAPAHRLVEQQHLRVERQRPAELDALLEPVGERAGGPAPEVLDLEEVDDVLDPLAVLDLLILREPPVDERLEHARLHVDVPAQHEVVEHGHALEERDVLKGAGDSARGDPAR